MTQRPRSVVRLQRWRNVCTACGREYVSLEFGGDGYETVLARSDDGETAFVFPDDSRVWSEVDGIAKPLFDQLQVPARAQARAFQVAFGRTLDLSTQGTPFVLWGSARCPFCGGGERATAGPIEPPEFVEVPPRAVTHQGWRRLTQREKRELIREAIREYVES
jgi:hypothetical protein